MVHESRPRGAARRLARALAPLLLLVALSVVAAALASAGGPTEYLAGDISVAAGAPTVWENRTVVLTGNLTVGAGARMTMVNSTLLFALPANGSFSVLVRTGGTFEMLDGDGAPSTAVDRSSLGSTLPERRYTLVFEAGSNVLVRGSEVRDFGYDPIAPGMLVQSSNVSFVGSTLGAYAYLRVESSSPRFESTAFEGGGQGSNYFYASDSTLLNCTFTRHVVAVSALQGSSLTIEGALWRDLAYAIAVNGSTVDARNGSLVNSSQGVFLTNGAVAILTDVALGSAPVAFLDNASLLQSFRFFRALVLNQASDPVRLAGVEFQDNTGGSMASGQTGGDGVFGPVSLLAYNETQAGQVVEANYTVRAWRALNQSQVSFSALTESPQLTLSILANLDPSLALVRPAPGSVLLEGVVATFEAAVSDPDATPGGLVVTWRDASLGVLGTGALATFSLPNGSQTLTVEVQDSDNGFRALSFSLDVVLPERETFTDAGDPAWVVLEVGKAPMGAFLITQATGGVAAPLAVGPAWDVRPSTGTVVWSNGSLTLFYDPFALPYGVNTTTLVVAGFNGTAWVVVPGSQHNTSARSVSVSVTPASGLGRFVVLATVPSAVAPDITPIPRLIAVHEVRFSFPVVARDTPGQTITFGLEDAPAWAAIDADAGTLTGVAPATVRGLLRFNVTATDSTALLSRAAVELFVTSSSDQSPPRLVNAVIVPARPSAGTEVTVQVTYFDAEDDRPTVIELLVDGDPVVMDALDAHDIFWLDGKVYVARVTFEAGTHNLSFRTNDGAPGHSDVILAGLAVEATSDSVATLNNVFLSLFLSAALTFAFIVWMATARRDPKDERKPAPPEPEDRVAFLEGPALGRIEPQAPPPSEPPKGKEDLLEEKADSAAANAARIADEVDAELSPSKRR